MRWRRVGNVCYGSRGLVEPCCGQCSASVAPCTNSIKRGDGLTRQLIQAVSVAMKGEAETSLWATPFNWDS